MDPEVADHDPGLALYGGGSDGLRIPEAMARRAAELLRPGGHLLLEHGESQREALSAAVSRAGDWVDCVDRVDLNDRPRFLEAVRA